MKQTIFVIALSLISAFTFAQKSNSKNMEKRLQTIEDKMAIKNVVDVFSNLADTKEIDKQVLLFTEDGTVTSISDGQPNSTYKGREELFKAFSGFLSNFKTVFHQNGQQTIDELTENTAKATSYCTVLLIGEMNGKPVTMRMFTIYKDEFVKQNGKWLINKRTSNFVHRETEEIK